MREWGVEAITYLVQAAFQYHHNNPVLVTEVSETQNETGKKTPW